MRKHHPGGNRPEQEKTSLLESGRQAPVVNPVSRRRLWLMRLFAMTFVPLLVLGSIELGLRLGGYGYDTGFFRRIQINGRDFYVPNEKFGCRFFPPALVRTTDPFRFAAEKATHSYRIFLFGESAANGEPDSTYGVGRYLEVLLRERYPGTDFQMVCVAMTGIDSSTILPIARDCARHQGDLWLIYMGNNEMVGPFGAETVYGPQAPGLGIIRTILAVRATRIGQVLDSLVQRLKINSAAPKNWGGMQMFLNCRIGHDDPARLRAYANFKGNLEDILRTAHRAGVPVILSTVAVNLKDCAPFASIHAAGLNTNQEAAWNKIYEEGVDLETAGSYREALASYQKAAGVDPQFADLQFRMGTCDLALTNHEQARRDFELARDNDALDFRADTRINAAIRETASRHAGRGVFLLDAASVLAQSSPHGIPGLEFFYEHVHLNFAGNYLLALNFAEQVKKLLPNSITARDKGNWAAAELCGCRLAVTVWDRQRVWQPILSRIKSPPFTGQFNHTASLKIYGAKLDEAASMMNTQTPEEARQMYEQALALAPDDYFLHGNFERFLEKGGYMAPAITEAKRCCELVPQLPGGYYYAGTLLVRQGRIREAEENFARAVAINSDYTQAHNELGLILAGQQKIDEAMASFAGARRADPSCVDTYLNLGFLEQHRGNMERAMARYEEAARLQPQGPADYFNRAVKLAASHRSAEAIECFRALLLQVPAFWQARFLLGAELADGGRNDEARAQFSEVLRYRPDYAPMLPHLL